MRSPALGIGPRILILGALTLCLLAALVWGAYRRGLEVLRESAEEAIRGRAQAVAAEFDRGTVEALTAARGMALAVVDGGPTTDERLENLARGPLEGRPRFTGGWIALSPGDETAAPRVVAWSRDAIDAGTIVRSSPPSGATRAFLAARGYAAAEQAVAEGGRSAGGVVTLPHEEGGRMVIEHVWPIVDGGRFLGAAGVACALAEWETGLARVRDRLERTGWPATLSVVSAEGTVIASTGSRERVPVDARGWVNLLEDLRRDSEMVRGGVERTSSAGLQAGADVPTSGWTVVVHLAWNAITRRVQRPMFDILLAACGALGLLLAALTWLAGRVRRRVRSAAAAARRVAEGDLTVVLQKGGSDETGQLLRDLSHMTHSLRSIVEQVKHAGSDLSATSRDLAAAEADQEEAIHSLGASTTEAAAASRQISVTGRELLSAMDDVASVANDTAAVAVAGRENLGGVGETMRHLEESTADFGRRLALIRQRAEDINMVITTITKVADQTNLLSINAAIEAEKAGEYGQGFIVVAREIRRLADQTAVATLDIERLVEQMQQSVSDGVSEMDRFAAEVKAGVERVTGISGQFAEVIGKVEGLSGRFDQVNDGMRAQAAGAQQIAEALVTLTDGSRAAADALQEFQEASRSMARAVDGLNQSVSRFRLGDPDG
ncbi:MAG: methyl-accepting chemotaxis protein [Planctomycetaceae bacterium]